MQSQPDRFIRMPELKRRLGIGKTKIYEMVKEGELPAPRKIGRASVWPASLIDAVQQRMMQ